ncbi:unannotated protein [freshwater metagenome]|uniref:Unannotated protein n=1 Tax=freshwater metagenome TaxID=449393 RepID=A0A6J7B1V2_9ZZZZ
MVLTFLRARLRKASIISISSAISGTIFLAASVGVDARKSATRSRSGESFSWPMALTIGVVHDAAKRTKPSSLNGSKSSKDPPPRVMTITSISGSASSSRSAADTSVTAAAPWTVTSRISKTTLGQRRLAFSTTSFSASVFRPQISPTFFGRSGSSTLRSKSKRPSAASSDLSASRRANNSPTPTCRISRADKVSEPFFVYQDGFA